MYSCEQYTVVSEAASNEGLLSHRASPGEDWSHRAPITNDTGSGLYEAAGWILMRPVRRIMQMQPETAKEGGAAVAKLRLLTVLLVDDEKIMHDMLGVALNGTDYSLVSAKNVNEAMNMISSHPPDIVITDAMMPGVSGFSLITSLKADPKTTAIPVILWTVLEERNGDVMDSSGKADIAMSKPFNLGDVLDSLTRARQLMKAPNPEASEELIVDEPDIFIIGTT
jgi:CheY-like chemotaxis protein